MPPLPIETNINNHKYFMLTQHENEDQIMKTTLALLLLLAIFTNTFAADYELDKGTVEISGELTFTSQSGDLYEYKGKGITTFSLNPQFMFFIAPNLALGGVLGYNDSRQGDFSMITLSAGPGMAFYFGDRDKKVWPFLSGSFILKSFSYGYGDAPTTNGTTLHFAGGLAHKLVDHFILKTGLYYNIDSEKGDWNDAKKESGNVFGIMMAFSGFIY